MSSGPASGGARRLAFLVVVCLLLGGCFGSDDDKAAAEPAGETSVPAADLHPADASSLRDGGTLRIGVESFPASFNPVHADGVNSTAPQILAPTLGSAVKVADDGTWRVDPDYASSVEVADEDPLTVRVELNPKAVWQGGTPITSADMVSFADAMQDEAFAAAAPAAFDDVDSVKPDGRFAYDVVFDKPNAEWASAVYPSLPKAFTSSPEIFNSTLATQAPSSNGPFRVASIERKTGTITLERNPRWWGQAPRLTSIVFRIGEADVLAAAFTAGELDAVPVTPENLSALSDVDAPMRVSAGSDWSHLTINGGSGPLADANVRRAVWAAVDADAIVEATGKRYGAQAARMDTVVLLPGQVGHRSPPRSGRNLKLATSFLRQAGWKRSGDTGTVMKDGKPLTLRLPVPDTMTGVVQRAEQISANLAEVGIDAKVTEVPGASFFARVVIPLDFDLTTFTWRGSAFPLGSTKPLFTPIDSPLNFTGKASDAMTEAFDDAIGTLNAGKRAGKIAQIEQVGRGQASIMPLAVAPRVMAVASGLANYGPTTLAELDWTRVGFTAASSGD